VSVQLKSYFSSHNPSEDLKKYFKPLISARPTINLICCIDAMFRLRTGTKVDYPAMLPKKKQMSNHAGLDADITYLGWNWAKNNPIDGKTEKEVETAELVRRNVEHKRERLDQKRSMEIFVSVVCHSRKIAKGVYVRDFPDELLREVLAFVGSLKGQYRYYGYGY